jgi:hypothetical protein
MVGRRQLLGVLAGLLLAPRLGLAHQPAPVADRELVRLQGHRRADGDAPAGRIELTAQGAVHPFAATARDVYGLSAEAPGKPADRYTLQGPRPLLARFVAARPEQLVTILAEHRPGSSDLFVLALDLCPGDARSAARVPGGR